MVKNDDYLAPGIRKGSRGHFLSVGSGRISGYASSHPAYLSEGWHHVYVIPLCGLATKYMPHELIPSIEHNGVYSPG